MGVFRGSEITAIAETDHIINAFAVFGGRRMSLSFCNFLLPFCRLGVPFFLVLGNLPDHFHHFGHTLQRRFLYDANHRNAHFFDSIHVFLRYHRANKHHIGMQRKQHLEVDVMHSSDFGNLLCFRRVFAKFGYANEFVLRPHKKHHLGNGGRNGDNTPRSCVQLYLPVIRIFPCEKGFF